MQEQVLIIVHLPTQTDIYSQLKSVNVIKFKKGVGGEEEAGLGR